MGAGHWDKVGLVEPGYYKRVGCWVGTGCNYPARAVGYKELGRRHRVDSVPAAWQVGKPDRADYLDKARKPDRLALPPLRLVFGL